MVTRMRASLPVMLSRMNALAMLPNSASEHSSASAKPSWQGCQANDGEPGSFTRVHHLLGSAMPSG